METYKDWLKQHESEKGGQRKIVEALLENPVFKKMPVYFEIKNEK